jgi:hypothetical protein
MSVMELEQPRSLDYERELLSHLSDQTALETLVREGVSLSVLYAPLTKSAFQFAVTYFEESNKAPTLEVLKTEYPMIEWEPPSSEISWVIEKLNSRYKKNRVEETIIEAGEKLVENPDEALKLLRARVVEVDQVTSSEATIFKPGDHKQFLADLQEKILAGAFKGVSIGYPEVDKFTGGLKKGQAGYLMARPKMKKTFNWLKAFIQQGIDGERPFLSTLENSSDEIKLRLSAMLSGYPWDKIQRGDVEPGGYKMIERAWEQFNADSDGYWIDQPIDDERTVPAIFARAQKLGATSVLISQFRYIHGSKDFYRQEHEKYAEIAQQIKRYASSTGLPVYVECQFNRGGDSMQDLLDFDASKVGLTDMIPQSADVLYGLFQNYELYQSGMTEFGILLARDHDRAAWHIQNEFKTTTSFELVEGSQH